MNEITADSIEPATRGWFGNQLQSLAMRHELTGPDIRQISEQDYKKKLTDELRSRARAAVAANELQCNDEQIETYCPLAAQELIRTRQIRAAYKAGELPVAVLRQLPAYEAFPDYFEEEPSLVRNELIAVANEMFNAPDEDDSDPLSQPGHPSHPVSQATRMWMERQALGLACADDAWGAPFGTVAEADYVTDSAFRIRRNARRAIRAGQLHIPPNDVDNVCWVTAGEGYLLRSLRAAVESGKLSEEQIRKMPIYGPYKDYFENETDLAALAEGLGAAIGLSIRPPNESN